MKPFVFLVIVMVILTLLPGKVYPQSRVCDMLDIRDCFLALDDPGTPPTEKCCDELKQHRKCFCFYDRRGFTVGFDSVVDACHIEFHDVCPALSK